MQRYILIVIACMGIAAILFIDQWQANNRRNEKAAELKHASHLCRIGLTEGIATRLSSLEALASLFKLHPDTTPEEFADFSALLLKFNPPIRALQFADSKTRVKYVYPAEGNIITARKPMLLLADPLRGPFTGRAIKNKKATVQGPYELRQGGTGIVVRVPVFMKDEFIGLAIGIYDVPVLIQEALAGIDMDKFHMRLADSDGQIFWGPERISGDSYKEIVPIADTEWILNLTWKSKDPPLVSRLLLWLFGGGFLVSTLLLLRFSLGRSQELERSVKERTTDLADINKKLVDEISIRQQAEAALSKSEEQFRAIAANTPDHILMQDRDLRYLLVVNPQLGLTEKDMLGKTDYDFLSKEDAEKLIKIKIRVLETGKPAHLETSLVSLSGETEYFNGAYVPRFEAQGRVAGLIGYFRNVTKQKQVEAALRESEARLRLVMDGLGPQMFVGLMDTEGVLLVANRPALEAAELSMEGVVGKPFPETYWWAYSGPVQKRLGSALRRAAQGEAVRYDEQIRVAEGRFIWVDFTVQPLRDSSGKIAFLVPSAVVITERKQAEEELRTINKELLALNRIISTTTTGSQEILEGVLDEALAITGLEGGTICLVTPDDTLRLAAQRAASEATIQDLTTNTIKIGDCLCGECARDGRPLILPDREAILRFATREATRGEDISFHAAFPLLAAEKCLGVLCIFTRTDKKPSDRRLTLLETVSAQIALAVENAQLYQKTIEHAARLEEMVKERTRTLEKNQKALINVVEDLNEKSEALNAANVRLQELDRLKNIFLASMSHELRTPLNSIIGFTGILLMGMTGKLTKEQKNQLGMVKNSAHHLLGLINDILDISKIEAGMMEPVPEEFSLNELIQEAMGSVSVTAAEKGLELFYKVPKNILLFSDQKRIHQIVLNLLSNAVKFTEKGSVKLSARIVSGFGFQVSESDDNISRKGAKPQREMKGFKSPIHNPQSTIQISVADTGIGIKEEDMNRLFFPFQQVDASLTKKFEGTGLGLYLSKKLANLLGGDITVRSEYGKGSEFVVELPMKINKNV